MTPRDLPLIVVDTREPHPHARVLVMPPDWRPWPRCATCGGVGACEPTFRPWVFAPHARDLPFDERPRLLVPTRRATLSTGDYSLPGLENVVAIERKSGPDLLGTLFGYAEDSALGERVTRLEVFRAELERSRALARFCIVVEAPPGWLFAEARRRWEWWRKSFDPVRALELLWSFEADYGVPVIWAGARSLAELYVGRTLARVWSQHTGGAGYKTAVERGYAAALRWARAEPTPEARAVMDEVAAQVSEEPPAETQPQRRIEVPPPRAYSAARERGRKVQRPHRAGGTQR